MSGESPHNAYDFTTFAEELLQRRTLRRIAIRRVLPGAGFLFATGLALLFAKPNDFLSQVGVEASTVEWIGIILTTSAFALLLVSVSVGLFGRIPRSVRRFQTWWLERGYGQLVSIPISDELLKKVHQLDARAFADDATDFEEFKRLSSLNPGNLKAWARAGSEVLLGFYLFSGLKQATADGLLNGEILRARDIYADGFSKSFSRASAIYVHDVLAFTIEGAAPFTRGRIVGHLLADLFECISRGRFIRYVFARPVTSDGRRQARRFGMAPLDPSMANTCVWYVDLDRYPRSIFQSRSRR